MIHPRHRRAGMGSAATTLYTRLEFKPVTTYPYMPVGTGRLVG